MTDILFMDLGQGDDGDLLLSPQGDLTTVSGIENLTDALKRRFETQLGALFYDTTYGNPLLDRLSQPMGQTFEQDAIADVSKCILGDSRVQSVIVSVSINRESRTSLFQVSYVAQDGSTGSFERSVIQRV
jgi:phage baseplate assembly protein W